MPPSYNQLLDSLHRAQVYQQVFDPARERGQQRESNLFRSLVGTSRAIQQVRQLMQQVADTEVGVLLLGESGSGKEVVARNLHYHSTRRERPFVPVSCTAIEAELLEGELFGYEQGAFPGAHDQPQGASGAGRRRHAVPRRGGAPAAGPAGPPAARAAGGLLRASGRPGSAAHRRAGDRRHPGRPGDAWSPRGASATTSTTASTSSPSSWRRCASGSRTSRC